MNTLRALLSNPVLIYSALSWILAQGLKVMIYHRRHKEWMWHLMFSTGGMPSSHSAFVCALAMTIGFRDGFNSSLFAIAVGFGLVVMTDAMGVRRAAGNHATVLNHIVEELFQGHPINEEKLDELLGHTLTQVLSGALLGMLCSIIGMLLIWNGGK